MNQILFRWDKFGKQLLNHSNVTQETLKLLSDSNHTFAEQLHGLSGDRLLEGIAEGLGKFNSFNQAKMVSFSYAIMFTLIVCLVLLFLMVWGRKPPNIKKRLNVEQLYSTLCYKI